MFGDKVLVGYSSTNVDEKNRLVLPKFTCANAGDILIVIPEDDKLAIYSNYILEEYLDKLDRITDRKEYKELLIEYRSFCESVLLETTVDKSRRISLSSNIVFNSDNKNVEVRGSGDRLLVTGDFYYPELYRKRSSK